MPVTTLVDADTQTQVGTPAKPLSVSQLGPAPVGATALVASSGNVAAATATATLAAAAGKTTYIQGFMVSGGGATAAAVVAGTITNLVGGVTGAFVFGANAGAGVPSAPLVVQFPTPIPASAPNTAIAVSMPSLGAGATNAAITAWGFQV